MARSKTKALLGFGFDATESEYHFAVVMPRDARMHVTVEERFTAGASADPEATRPAVAKAYLDTYRWSRIADVVRAQFNKRLRDAGLPTAQWKAGGETLLPSYFGKELTLLVWAIEDADPTLIPNMVANWLGLAPEERWWLYTTVNATSGRPEHGRDRGWRKAIKIAFAENPAPGSGSVPAASREPVRLPLPADLLPMAIVRADADERPDQNPPKVEKRRTRGHAPPHAQLELRPEELP
jgi:hypothetical protein